jgi:hypothetical protein
MSIFFCYGNARRAYSLWLSFLRSGLLRRTDWNVAEIPLIAAKGRFEDRPNAEFKFQLFQNKGGYIRIRGLVQ